MKRSILILIALLLVAAFSPALDQVRRNMAWSLESNNDPIIQFTNEGEVGRMLTIRILIGDSSYRYRADFEVPSGENRFIRIREILDQLSQRYPELKKAVTGLMQVEYEGLDREVKTRMVNLNPRTGVISDQGSEVVAPVIRSVDPAAGNPAGGTVVRIVGDNFTDATSVKFGGVPAMRSFQSREVLVAVAPAHAVGTVDVEVVNGRRVSRLDKGFRYESDGPYVLKIDPEEGSPRGGTRLNIQGKNFQPGVAVRWDGKIIESRFQGPESITLMTPPGRSGHVSMEIINPDGRNYLFPDAFKYKGLPRITYITPGMGTTNGGYTVTINGSDFETGASVLFGGHYGQTTFINSSALAAMVPQGDSGFVDVGVSNPDGELVTVEQGFLYNNPPVIRSITADPDLIVRQTSCRIHVEAVDPEVGPLSYDYRVAQGDGSIVAQGPDAVFNSANVSGRIIIEVTVSDIHRSEAKGLVEITVQ